MGNHAVGRAMVACAEIAAERRKDGESALDILDMAADKSDVRGMDAEFDDAFLPGTPMFALVVEAFGEGQAFDEPDEDDCDDFWDRFYDGPYAKFSERYELC